MDVKSKVVLITGASSGIGKAAAVTLAKQGASVIINYKSDDNLAKQVLAECNKFSKKNMIIKADITKESEVGDMFKKITKEYVNLDVLINNAGIFDETDSFTNTNAFESIFNNNFLGHIRVIKNALEIMKTGKIVNITSIHGKLGQGRSDVAAYSAFKSAFNHYSLNLAKELAPKIIVNVVAPGKTLTPMWGSLTKEEEKKLAADQLINRFILPEEIADGILFILKNDAVCGEILTIDGGMALKTLN